jgi:KH domain
LEACENAEHLVETLFVVKANDIETMVDDDEPPVTHALTNGSSSEGYRPAPVASLIHNTGIAVGATLLEEQIGVPNGIVGFIIGRGGESIASMQARTGCKVQIQKENEMQPGTQVTFFHRILATHNFLMY